MKECVIREMETKRLTADPNPKVKQPQP